MKSENEEKKEVRRSYYVDGRIFRLQLGEKEVHLYQEALDRMDKDLMRRAKRIQDVFLNSF